MNFLLGSPGIRSRFCTEFFSIMHRFFLLTLVTTLCPAFTTSAEDWAPGKPSRSVPPEMLKVSPSLEVTVWASTPQFYNPTNMDIDHAGRIWVAEGVNYRGNQGRRPAGDRIVVLQDTDGDGRCDRSHTFVQEKGFLAPLGVAVFDNVVYVAQPPDLLAYTDVNRDLVFDPAVDKREVILTGFNAINHDHGLHSLVAGPGGKFYFNNGNCGAVFTDKSNRTFYLGGTYGSRGPNWPADHLSTTGKRSDDGHVWTSGFAVRMDPDGSNCEIVSHGLRNSYEQILTSFGDMFQNDNDDPRGCRTSFALEYGCAGYFTRDGRQRNKAVRRPGQSYPRIHWRQDDPGTMDAGDVYGGGAPTGITFYENGALPEKWEGTLLSCDSALNTILGYQPTPRAGTFNLERFDFVTSNPEKNYDGADFVGGSKRKTFDGIAPTFFRPSDVTVGPDGAIYFCDWFDPRVGASSNLDDSCSGTIYRIAPRNFKPAIPRLDLDSIEGQVAALRSPAVNTRHLGFRALRARGAAAFPAVARLLEEDNKWIAARAVWLLPHLGAEGLRTCLTMLGHEQSQQRVLAYRALRRAGHDMIPHARRLASDPSPQVRREVALSLRDLPARTTSGIFAELARQCDTTDKNSLEAIGLGAANKESEIWSAIRAALKPGPPEKWSDSFCRLTWRLWGAASIEDLKQRALSRSLSLDQRKFAVESIAFIDDSRAARAMLDLAAEHSPVKGEATAWLLRNLPGEWAQYGLARHLAERGIFDPESITLAAAPVPSPETPPSLAGILQLKGDAARGRAAATRCILCHEIDGSGKDYGPSLRGWGATQPRDVIARAIADPSAEIALGYQGTEVLLKDGSVIHGLAFNNSDLGRADSPPVVIQSAGGITQLIPKERIAEKRSFKRSLMYDPHTLGLTPQDIADITAWLQAYR